MTEKAPHILGRAFRTLAASVTLLLWSMTLLGGWAGYIPPHVWALPSILCLIFPALWLGSLIVTLLWLWPGRCRRWGLGGTLILLATIHTMGAVSPLSLPRKAKEGQKTFNLLTYNVIHGQEMQQGMPQDSISRSFSYIIASHADIVCLQELFSLESSQKMGFSSQTQIDSLKSIYPHRMSAGVVEGTILSKYPIQVVKTDLGTDENGRDNYYLQLYKVALPGLPIYVVNVHLSSYELTAKLKGEEDKLLAQGKLSAHAQANARQSIYTRLSNAFVRRAQAASSLSTMVKDLDSPVIVCGDFNDVPGSWAYRTARKAGLKDAYTDTELGPMITFNAEYMLFHIDQVLYNGDGCLYPLDCFRGKLRSSDHYPVMVRFAYTPKNKTNKINP